MSVELKVVQWTPQKKVYDALVVGGIVAAIGSFATIGLVVFPPPGEVSAPILVMRALGATAVMMLHVILAIGPLARLTPLAAPLLYNRRHLGVSFFFVCLLHALIATGFYGGFGEGWWILNVTASTGTGVPFELLGFMALTVFFAMAATSHDFWNATLGPRWWKTLHMLVYAAYGLVVAHVMLGGAQERPQPIWPILLGVGALTLTVLHVAAALRSRGPRSGDTADNGWVDAGPADDIPHDRAAVISLPDGAPVAVFRTSEGVSAMSNVCAHQGGPIGEGKIVDGCATCPWHGYQYRTDDGCSPPPYTERISTYDVRLEGGRVLVRDRSNPLGSAAETATIERGSNGNA
ncbi:MAG: Rieske 2Fe-2S domain-containing protein [Planctomycetota bacterium]